MENTINSPHVPSKAPLQKELTFCSIGAMHLVSNEKWGGGVMCQMVQLVMGLASMVYVHEFYYIYIYIKPKQKIMKTLCSNGRCG